MAADKIDREIDREIDRAEEAEEASCQPSDPNRRMFYEQTMETYRQMIRAGASYIFMSVAIQGLGIQVILWKRRNRVSP